MKKVSVISIIFGVLTAALLMLFISNAEEEMADMDEGTLLEEEEIEEEDHSTLLDISEGYRAISITVDEVQGVSGFIRPGDYVDVISHLPTEAGTPMTQILLQNIRVLSVGSPQTVVEEVTSYRTVTLEVTPVDGATLSLASENGLVVFILRGADDNHIGPNEKVRIEQLQEGE